MCSADQESEVFLTKEVNITLFDKYHLKDKNCVVFLSGFPFSLLGLCEFLKDLPPY